MTRLFLLFGAVALTACAPKAAPLETPVKVETEPTMKTVPPPPEAEDETAPPDDPEESGLEEPAEESLDQVTPVPEPEGPTRTAPHGN